VKVPSWLVTLLVSLLLVVLTTVFYAGATFRDVQQMRERIEDLDKRVFEIWERGFEKGEKNK
jgi:hypothetical protein